MAGRQGIHLWQELAQDTLLEPKVLVAPNGCPRQHKQLGRRKSYYEVTYTLVMTDPDASS